MSGEQVGPRVPIEKHETTLTLAVKLVDAYTGTRPVMEHRRRPVSPKPEHECQRVERRRRNTMGYPHVSLTEVDADAVQNSSGFHLFLDTEIPDDAIVDIDGGRRYLDERPPVSLDALTPLRPPEEVGQQQSPLYQEIRLRPSPVYRFPPGATLLRGRVQDPAGDGVEGATLTILGLDRTTETTETTRDGEFVLYFTDITADDVAVEDGDRLIQVDRDTPQVEVSHDPPGDDTAPLGTDTVPLVAEEGVTRSYVLSYDKAGNVTTRESVPA